MDNKYYVSYEAARLLKEKGYNEVCDTAYDNERIIGKPPTKCNNTKLAALSFVFGDDCYSAPTKAEAIDWLESKGFYVDLLYTLDGKWNCVITIPSYGMVLDDMELFDSRLEAEGAAIIKALELL